MVHKLTFIFSEIMSVSVSQDKEQWAVQKTVLLWIQLKRGETNVSLKKKMIGNTNFLH